MATAVSNRCGLWFGTIPKSSWFRTPLSGADSSPQAWGASGTTLNGHGYSLGSWGSHKVYNYEWSGASAREVAQLMKSYADGTYGRGLIYFQDPLTFDTNVLSARLADPSMALGFEGTSLVYGVQPTATPTGANTNDLPVTSAVYDLAGVTPGFRGEQQAIYVPIPEGYTLFLGAFHSFTGDGGVFASPQNLNGTIGAPVKLSTLANDSTAVVQDKFTGVSGVWIWVGKTSAAAATVTLRAMAGRLLQTSQTVTREVARNLFTNPNLVGDGTWAGVRRNLFPNPAPVGSSGWASQAGWNLSGIVGDWAEAEKVTSTAAGGTYPIGSGTGSTGLASVVPAETYTVSIEVVSDIPLSIGLTANWRNAAGSQIAITGPTEYVSIPAGTPTTLTEVLVAPALAAWAGGRVILAASQEVPLGTKFRARRMYVGSSGPYFDGSISDFSVDPDMRQRWLGTPNASESVMEIELVRGLSVVRCIAGVSTRDGKPAIRQIPTEVSSTLHTAITFPVPVGARSIGTWMATLHSDGEAFVSSGFRISAQTPNQYTASTPTSGAHSHLLNFSELVSTPLVGLLGGLATRGSGDVWWTDIGLFAGNYTGPAFSGSDPAGNNLVYSWAGTPDNSESIATFVPPQLSKLLRGPWMGGQGNAGCRFEGKPTYVENTGVNGGQVGFAATFREVG